jgi:SAM-dependent methyltransferase
LSYRPESYWPALHERSRGKLSAVGYQALGEGFNAVAYGRRRRALEALLRKLGASAEKVLEGAVGVGAYAPLWQRLGVREWFGVDISPAAVKDLRERYPAHRFLEADLSSADASVLIGAAEAGPFDLVCAIDVLYHLTADAAFRQALANLGHQARPGGLLVVSDVFVAEAVTIAEHVRRRPLAAYQEVLAPLGFACMGREPVFSVLGDPVAGASAASRLSFGAWRFAQKAIRLTPAAARGPVGALVGAGLLPLDWALRKAGVSRGVNLELAAFRRTAER